MAYARHGKNVIVLLDDYDVPLSNATSKGFYREMASFMDYMLSSVLKDNTSLQFAILMGFLRPAQSSVFTGFNNFKSFDSANAIYNTAFGCTPSEVRKLCRLAHADNRYDLIEQWYGGYRFGDGPSLCNPRDICNYLNALGLNPSASPEVYCQMYPDESGCTDFVREVLEGADSDTIAALAHLASGESMVVSMNDSLNCANYRERPENVWPLLYHTGYLTRADVRESGEEYATLTIPNRKVGRILQRWLASLPGTAQTAAFGETGACLVSLMPSYRFCSAPKPLLRPHFPFPGILHRLATYNTISARISFPCPCKTEATKGLSSLRKSSAKGLAPSIWPPDHTHALRDPIPRDHSSPRECRFFRGNFSQGCLYYGNDRIHLV